MTKSMHFSMMAIGRRLQAEYLPSAEPALPRELTQLLAQLVACEAAAQSKSSTGAVQTVLAQPDRP